MGAPYLEYVVRYYDSNQTGFDVLWSHDYLRYGLWDEKTRSLKEALLNTDRFVAEVLDLRASDAILDAGCGVGGSAIQFARTYGARVAGVNMCRSQLYKATRKALAAGLQHLVSFHEDNFSETHFPDGSFTKLYAIESVYHAEDYERFAREAHRLLATGGRLAIVDRFLLRDTMSFDETRLYERFKAGQAVAALATVTQFRGALESAGFANVAFTDQLQLARKGIARTHWLNVLTYPITLISRVMRILPPEVHGQTVGLMAIRRLFNCGVVTYGAFVAEKR